MAESIGSDEFWDVDDMTRPCGTPPDDASGFVYVSGELTGVGASPAERDGTLFGGKDCQPLARRIEESVNRFVRGEQVK
jgi:hypothetical protein